MEELHPRLAVDLGTTWTAACRLGTSGVEPVMLGSGHPSMPSVVARDGEQFVVGETAERLIETRPEAGAREVKRRFGDTTPVVIDGQPFGADALMAEILRHVARTAHPDGWSEVDVVLTHPANWGAYKLELLTNVGQQAGFRSVALQSEPVAAANHFVETGRVQRGDVVAVYDFGGGTFDAAVVRVGDDATVLGTPQGLERLGGIDIDQMVFAHVAASLDGELSQLDSNEPDVRRGIARLRAECTRAKESLSADADAMIPVSLPSIQTQVRITRSELEAILRQRIDDTLSTLDRAIASAGVSNDDLAAVVLVGGSSQIPIVAERVRASVGRPMLFGNDPKLVVASGALDGALRAARPVEAATVTDASAAAVPTPATTATTATAAPAAAAHSRAPEPPPVKPTESRAGRIAGGVAGAAAAVAGGVLFHEQIAEATGVDPQVTGEAVPGMDAANPVMAAGPAAPPGPHDVDAQLADASNDSSDGDSMDAFDDDDSPSASAVAALADSASGVARPTPAPAFEATPPIDDFRSIDLPSAPASTATPTFDPPSASQPMKAPMPAAPAAQKAPEPAAPAAAAVDAQHERITRPTPPMPADTDMAMQSDARANNIDTGADDGGSDGDPAFDAAKARLLERVAGFDPPAGASAAETADLKADLQQLIDRFEPRAGESTADALAALRAQYDDRIRDFTQDQKIDALIQETQRDNARAAQQETSAAPADEADAPNQPADTPIEEPSSAAAGGQMAPLPPVDDPVNDAAPPIVLHADPGVDRELAEQAVQILRQMESDRRTIFGGGIQEPGVTMQYYADQQAHMATLQQLITDQQAVALQTDGAMPSDDLLERLNTATAGLVAQANAAMTEASRLYASVTGGITMFTPPPLAPIPVTVPPLPDPAAAATADAEAEAAAAAPDPSPGPPTAEPEPPTAYEMVAAQVAATNQALQAQAMTTGAPFQPIQVPLDPDSGDPPDLAAINSLVAQQTSAANAMMASQAAALGRPMTPVPIPTITLPDSMYTSGAAGTAAQDDAGAASLATIGTATAAANEGAGASSADAPGAGSMAAQDDAGAASLATIGTATAAANEGAGASSADAGLADPFDAQMADAGSSSQFESGSAGGDAPMTAEGAGAAGAAGAPPVVDQMVQYAEMLGTTGQPLAGEVHVGGAVVQAAAPVFAEAASNLPLPDPTSVPDILGDVDATNGMQGGDMQTPGMDAPDDGGGSGDTDLPTIPDDAAPAAPINPSPEPEPVVPVVDVVQAPSLPDLPDLSQLPDLPDLPGLPDAPDFSDAGPSFGDDIGSDVSPADPTSTDF